jgi:hypothetical protein
MSIDLDFLKQIAFETFHSYNAVDVNLLMVPMKNDESFRVAAAIGIHVTDNPFFP